MTKFIKRTWAQFRRLAAQNPLTFLAIWLLGVPATVLLWGLLWVWAGAVMGP